MGDVAVHYSSSSLDHSLRCESLDAGKEAK